MKVTLWTIQNEAAFEVFQKTGVLRADPSKLIFDGDFQKYFQNSDKVVFDYYGNIFKEMESIEKNKNFKGLHIISLHFHCNKRKNLL